MGIFRKVVRPIFGGGGGGGSGSKFGKVNTCNLVFIKFAHCVYFNDYLRSCC